MDHVLLCSDYLAPPPIEVLYIWNENFTYDGLGFLTYPERTGVDIELLAEDEFPTLALRDSGPFLQAWLWFGMLGEALDIRPRQNADLGPTSFEEFIKAVEGQRYLCTKRLNEFLSITKKSCENPLYSERYRERLSSCFQSAFVFIRKALRAPFFVAIPSLDTQRENLHPAFQVFLACQIHYETLLDTL